MLRRARLICMGGALPTATLLTHGCRSPTQVTLEIATGVACPELRGVEIVVAARPRQAEERAGLAPGGNSRFPTAVTNTCTDGPAPRSIGTLVVTPTGSEGAVVVVASLGKTLAQECLDTNFAPECIVARRRFTFVDHLSATLPLVLDPECAGIKCTESTTCLGKKCVDAIVDCSSGQCGEPGRQGDSGVVDPVDGTSPSEDGSSPDGSVEDASSDGRAEGGLDGGPLRGCPSTAACLGDAPTACPTVGAYCCYATTPGTCTTDACPGGPAGCCRGSTDCNPGDICCASTPTMTSTTRFECRTNNDCRASSGVPVCSDPVQGCGGFTCLIGSTYSANTPRYYFCGS